MDLIDMFNLIQFCFKIKKIIKYCFFILAFLLLIGGKSTLSPMQKKIDQNYMQICRNIAQDIGSLKKQYPQLKKFEVSKNLNIESCKIEYEYKCHASTRRVGWVSQVPNPDPDGIWFYISLWDENDPIESMSQINTQPAMPLWYIKNRRVTYLILIGTETKPLYKKISEILKKHGLQESK